MPASSTQDYKKKYTDEGYAIFRRVLDDSALNLVNRHLESLCRKQSGAANVYAAPVKDDPIWAKLVADKRLLDIAEMFIGADIVLFGANYIVKQAGDLKPVLWHQDAPNWRLNPLDAVTLWLAIDDSTTASGCLKVIPGSHKGELHKLEAAHQTPNIFGWQTPPTLVDAEKAVDVILKKGDVSVHHPKVIHGSDVNRSSGRRAGMSVRYVPASVCIADNEPWANALLLRGKAQPGINHYHEPPGWV